MEKSMEFLRKPFMFLSRGSKKRGMSDVVAVVLLVFLATMLAVTAGLYLPRLAVEDVSVVQDVAVETEGGYTYYNPESETAFVQAQTGSGDAEIEKLEFVFSVGGNSVSVFREEVGGPNEERVYNFTKEEIGGVPESVKVVPIYFGKDIKRTPVVDEVRIPVARGGGSGGGGGGGSGSTTNPVVDIDPEILEEDFCENSIVCDDNVSYTDDLLCYNVTTGASNCTNEVVLNITYGYLGAAGILSGAPAYFTTYVVNKTSLGSVALYYREVGTENWIDSEVGFAGRSFMEIILNFDVNLSTIPSEILNMIWYNGTRQEGFSVGEYEFKYLVYDIEGNFDDYYVPNTLNVYRSPVEGDCIELINGSNNISEDRINVVFLRGIREGEVPYTDDELRDNAILAINRSSSDPNLDTGRYAGFLNVEPFKSNAGLFNFWYVTADDINTYSACSFQNRIMVKNYNSSGRSTGSISLFGCSADYQSSVSGSINMETHPSEMGYAAVLVHEMGHALGGLYDEYVEDSYNCSVIAQSSFTQTFPNVICVNKEFSEAEQETICEENAFWKNIGLGCVKGCHIGRNNCWRGTQDSLMRDTNAPSFNEVNERYICHILSCKGFGVSGSYCDDLCFGELGPDAKMGKIGCDVGEVCQAGECVNG